MRPAPTSPFSRTSRTHAARTALALCASADALAREVEVEVTSTADDHRLFALLEQRDVMLQDLAEQLVVLRFERPTADSALFAATERVVDDADALVSEVLTAVMSSHRTTVELAAKVGQRAEELRAELDAVQRASTAGTAYGVPSGARLVDRLR
jgi:hypothetical protein